MNREIKFRGKRKDNGELIYWYYIKENGVCCIMTESKARNFLIWNEVIPESVGQYTGKKYNNGEESYEWDIVEYPLAEDAGFPSLVKNVILWENNYSSFRLSKFSAEGFIWNKMKKIGNTTENKELLK